ncbi:hypothetical protein [Agrobacterium tumefaciens]|uniref:hypothetical protein n=1 Tax=Agrobacterium tumefaciens TaxID=358 RepID=UPI002856B268|nr:hypothetical protein [Agrobacterium tumefaciens]MDR6587398.1 hypothetical protein [Agrobacterium tumefaciens]
MAKDDIFEFDLRGFEKTLTKIEKTVLPTAQAGFLNGIAFGARKSLLKHADATIAGKRQRGQNEDSSSTRPRLNRLKPSSEFSRNKLAT